MILCGGAVVWTRRIVFLQNKNLPVPGYLSFLFTYEVGRVNKDTGYDS